MAKLVINAAWVVWV